MSLRGRSRSNRRSNLTSSIDCFKHTFYLHTPEQVVRPQTQKNFASANILHFSLFVTINRQELIDGNLGLLRYARNDIQIEDTQELHVYLSVLSSKITGTFNNPSIWAGAFFNASERENEGFSTSSRRTFCNGCA